MKYITILIGLLIISNNALSNDKNSRSLYKPSEHAIRIQNLQQYRIQKRVELAERRINILQKQMFVTGLGLRAPVVSYFGAVGPTTYKPVTLPR